MIPMCSWFETAILITTKGEVELYRNQQYFYYVLKMITTILAKAKDTLLVRRWKDAIRSLLTRNIVEGGLKMGSDG